MARITIDGIGERERKELLLRVETAQSILRDIALALRGPSIKKIDRPRLVTSIVETPVKLPQLQWKKSIAALRAGEIDEYGGLQFKQSASVSKFKIERSCPDLVATVEPVDARISRITVRRRQEAAS